jgi:hypothetical protein
LNRERECLTFRSSKAIMNKRFETAFPGRAPIRRGIWFSSHSDNRRDASLERDGVRGPELSSISPLPPTRAARVPRSRGTFLDGGRNAGQKKRHRALLTGFTLAIGGILLVLFACSPSIVSGVALSHNPGPAIVASASVAPEFVIPAKRR